MERNGSFFFSSNQWFLFLTFPAQDDTKNVCLAVQWEVTGESTQNYRVWHFTVLRCNIRAEQPPTLLSQALTWGWSHPCSLVASAGWLHSSRTKAVPCEHTASWAILWFGDRIARTATNLKWLFLTTVDDKERSKVCLNPPWKMTPELRPMYIHTVEGQCASPTLKCWGLRYGGWRGEGGKSKMGSSDM